MTDDARPARRPVRLSPLALAAVVAVPIVALVAMRAAGQDFTRDGDGVPYETQEYRVFEPNELLFVSVERAREFLRQVGNDGWIVPDGTHLIVHTFEPGTANQVTRFLVRGPGPYDEESAHLIVRRSRR